MFLRCDSGASPKVKDLNSVVSFHSGDTSQQHLFIFSLFLAPRLPLSPSASQSVCLASIFEQVFFFFFLGIILIRLPPSWFPPHPPPPISLPASSHLHIIIEVERSLYVFAVPWRPLLSWSLCTTLPHSVCKLDDSWTSDARRPIEATFRWRDRGYTEASVDGSITTTIPAMSV